MPERDHASPFPGPDPERTRESRFAPDASASQGMETRPRSASPDANLEAFDHPVPQIVKEFPFMVQTSDNRSHFSHTDLSSWVASAPAEDIVQFLKTWRDEEITDKRALGDIIPVMAEFNRDCVRAYDWDVTSSLRLPNPVISDGIEVWLRETRPDFASAMDTANERLHPTPEAVSRFHLRLTASRDVQQTVLERDLDLRDWARSASPDDLQGFCRAWEISTPGSSMGGVMSIRVPAIMDAIQEMRPIIGQAHWDQALGIRMIPPPEGAKAMAEWLHATRPDVRIALRQMELSRVAWLIAEPHTTSVHWAETGRDEASKALARKAVSESPYGRMHDYHIESELGVDRPGLTLAVHDQILSSWKAEITERDYPSSIYDRD